MALTPTYYNVGDFRGSGMHQGDTWKAIYNLWKALAAICYNIDEDAGATGVDYMDNIGTDLNTAMAKVATPNGSYT